MSDFIQLQFESSAQCVEEVEAALFALGALAVSELNAGDEALFETQKGGCEVWSRVALQALFDKTTNLDELTAALNQTVGPAGEQSWKLAAVADKDWHKVWMDRYEPICFGDRLWACPSWKPVPEICQYPIIIDPGTAFGTGTHPTTALCLEWLDRFDCEAKQVVDFGCGSGVLAIAAAILGASRVVAIDNDPDAVEICTLNCAKNNLYQDQVLSYVSGSAPDLLSSADLVLANILAGPLIKHAEEICAMLRPQGQLVLSGILDSQIEQVSQAYSGMICFGPPSVREEWVVLTGTKYHDG